MSRNFCNNTFKNGFTINICTSKSLNSIADVNARLRSIGGWCGGLDRMEGPALHGGWHEEDRHQVSERMELYLSCWWCFFFYCCRVWILFPAHLSEYKKLFKSTLYCDYNYIYYGHGGSSIRKVLSE